MELTRRFRVPTTLDRVWEAFSHLERVAPCFPGAVVVATGPDDFRGSVTLKIGPLPLTYAGSGRYLERSAGRRRVVVQAHGEDERGRGGAAARLTTSLHARGAETEVELVTELELTGKPTRYGEAVTVQAVDKLLDQFVATVTDRLAAGGLPPVPPVPPVPPLDGSVGGTVAPEVAAPAVDASVGARGGAVPPVVSPSAQQASTPHSSTPHPSAQHPSAPHPSAQHPSNQPRHSDGRPPVSGLQIPRRAQLASRRPAALLARRYAPAVLTAVGAAALALTVLGRRRS